ncbi:Cys-tRNA(Pro) deacylase [Jeotgalibacillus sp. ET6]|uniref:Cys-tRNA(Pro) deacylase n=1 Tax=Jeotgalibacillus sp. ET6 TaxID=3037260 RepID=UPI0024185DD2|nr:Cys-tRNA(Pro) deacylase [Jeotgalibacillus sp. ET6]MDG5472802.1 Cys-tRNA(Pro) deacylase [Jeotgalibacillus sp. ET6]
MKKAKTNAMRKLDAQKIPYSILEYEIADHLLDGVSVAQKINRPAEAVYKTLVTQSPDKQYYVFLVPAEKELHLKKAARTAGEKKLEMIPAKELLKVTGYIKGGCSPIGMKKKFPTFAAKPVIKEDIMIVSAGQIGMQIELKAEDLLDITEAKEADIV